MLGGGRSGWKTLGCVQGGELGIICLKVVLIGSSGINGSK